MSDEADWPQEPAERVRELVEGVLDELDLDGEVEIEEDDERILATVRGGVARPSRAAPTGRPSRR